MKIYLKICLKYKLNLRFVYQNFNFFLKCLFFQISFFPNYSSFFSPKNLFLTTIMSFFFKNLNFHLVFYLKWWFQEKVLPYNRRNDWWSSNEKHPSWFRRGRNRQPKYATWWQPIGRKSATAATGTSLFIPAACCCSNFADNESWSASKIHSTSSNASWSCTGNYQ